MTYNVGQVLFVLMSEQNKVLPCQVVEENTKKTLNGDIVTYKVIFGSDQANIIDLDKVKGKIFTSLRDVQKILLNNVTRWVNSHIEAANKASITHYKHNALAEQTRVEQVKIDDVNSTIVGLNLHDDHDNVMTIPDMPPEDETNLIEMPNGQIVKAKVKVTQR